MKFNDRMIRIWGDDPIYNPLAFMQCYIGDLGISLRNKICKKLNWTVPEYLAKLKRESPPTDKEMAIITKLFLKKYTQLGKRIIRKCKHAPHTKRIPFC